MLYFLLTNLERDKMRNEFILSEIQNLQQRKLNRIERKLICIPFELFLEDDTTYTDNKLKFLLHVYIYIIRSCIYRVRFRYSDFFEWTKESKDSKTRAKNKKQIEIMLKEMEDNNLIRIRKKDSLYFDLDILENFVHYSKESFYCNGFVSVYADEVQKIMDYDTSGIKGVSNGLLLYTYVWLVKRIKSYAFWCDEENPCYYVREFQCDLCNNIYSNKDTMKSAIKCLQELGLIYATKPKRYKKEDGSISHSATIFALPYIRDCKKGIEYYGENYINSVIEYAERR